MKRFVLFALLSFFALAVKGHAEEQPGPTVSRDNIQLCPELKNEAVYNTDKREILKFLVQGKDGWIYRTIDFRTDFSLSPKTESYLKRIAQALAEKHIRLVMMIQPPRAVTAKNYIDPTAMPAGYDPETARANFKALLEKLKSLGIAAVDLSDVPSNVSFFSSGDPHWIQEGAHYAAKKTAELIKTFPEYPGIKKKEFVIEPVGVDEKEKGSFEELVEQVCHVTIPALPRKVWATTESSQNVSEASLLGEADHPAITVAGTSNSAHDSIYNFVGSLKQLLSADVTNAALPGGAFGGASALYYASDMFHEFPPKIMVWEVLAHHDFNDYVMFRQMLPAISGPCDEADAVVKTSMQITGPETIIFNGLEKKSLDPKNHYLYIEAKNPEVRTLKIGILYANGDAEDVDLSRSERGDNNGKYYLEFNDDIDEAPMMIQISTDHPAGSIKARICRSAP